MGCVQCHPCACASGTVARVPHHRMPQVSEVNSDLVRAAGFQSQPQPRSSFTRFVGHDACKGRLTGRIHPTIAGLGIAPDGGFDDLGPRRACALHQGEILTPDRASCHGLAEPCGGPRVACRQEETRGLAV